MFGELLVHYLESVIDDICSIEGNEDEIKHALIVIADDIIDTLNTRLDIEAKKDG